MCPVDRWHARSGLTSLSQNRTQEPRSADSKRERDLEEKGYTTRPTDEALDEVQELKAKLDKRGN